VILDYHMHLRAPDESLDHTVEAVERFVEAAAERGVDEIGFTEHVYYFEQTKSLWSLPYQIDHCTYDLEPYVDAVVEAKRRDYPVKLGLEVDHQPDLAVEMDEILRPYPWDYLIGSVHFVDGLGIDQEPSLVTTLGPEAAWARYYEWVVDAAAHVDVLGHPDLVKFFGPELEWDWPALAGSLNGACLEVSSAGLHKPHGRLYPNPALLRAARDEGIPITTASDAHTPHDVGRDLDRAIDHARAAGYETVTVFEQRRARQEPLG
jgi:histidinol-phosphatase (PHP family)